MDMFSIFILSTAIGVGASREPASEKQDAYKALAKATYIQSGANKQVKQLEKQYIPKPLKEYGGIVSGATKILSEKKISFEWTF